MFAEDVELLPKGSFTAVLERCKKTPENFPHVVQQLWQAMNKGDFAHAIEKKVKRFNGNLFAEASVFHLGAEEIGELHEAAKADWREVEPAIFGTLLEQALDPGERKKLGAHYTPRSYVERLVNTTVIEPLQGEWNHVLATAERLRAAGKNDKASATVAAFHRQLCETRVLDPACGTGNFLYVSFELMKRLEGDVLEALNDLGGQEGLSELEGHTVDPHQFLGLEINPRAAAIAELVLWIGYLQWYFRTQGGMPSEPILKAFKNIESRNAVLTWDGAPLPQIIDGQETFPNARLPEWPEADYIVGNPPFIGGKDIRARLGDGITEALWKAHPHVNQSADFVMYWWDRAADLLTRKDTRLQRFGLITTNSITQTFQRRVVARYLEAKKPISLRLAIPDHPWTKATKDAAAVRIAMTVGVPGRHEGVLREVVVETGLDTDEPLIQLDWQEGKINADLTVGADVTKVKPLLANEGVCSPGVKLHGSGFIVTPQEAEHLGLGTRPGLENHIRPYRNGRDLTSIPRGVMVIDLLGLSVDEVRERFPEVYQYLIENVKSERDKNNRASYKKFWWVFGEPRKDLRPALEGLPRYIATPITQKHRVFIFLDFSILPDDALIVTAVIDPFILGVLSSRIHVSFALASGSILGPTPRWIKTTCFDPFPFPNPSPEIRAEIADLAEKIDALRKDCQAAHPGLTLTQIYNVLERLREIEHDKNAPPLSDDEQRIKGEGLVLILQEYHDQLDKAVARAYGWPQDLDDAAILERLVALNAARAKEEAKGQIRWLRPGYQIPRFAPKAAKGEQLEADLGIKAAPAKRPLLPQGEVAQTGAIMAALIKLDAPANATELAATFKQGQKAKPRIERTLAALARIGAISQDAGRYDLQR